MALQFLGALNSGASALGGIGSLLDAFGVGKPKQKYGPTPSEAQANALFQALLDPNNSLVKQNADINMQKGMQDLLMQLRLMQMQGQRQQARGVRNTFFDPERQDEAFNFLLTRGQPAIGAFAREKAIGDIRSTAESLKGFGDVERARRDAMYANRDRDYSEFKTAGGFGGLGSRLGGGLQDLLGALFGRMTEGSRPSPTAVGPMPGRYSGGIF